MRFSPARTAVAKAIADYIGVPLGDATVSSFPDGETFVKINENIRGRDVFIIQPTCPPTNQNLMELLILVDAARRASAARITAVIPFFGYARQDRKDQPRVPITAKLVANLLVAAGVNRLLTMDLHAQQLQGFFDIPVDHLYALPVLSVVREEHQRFVGFLPTWGCQDGIGLCAGAGAGLAIVVKRRISTETGRSVIGEVRGRGALCGRPHRDTATAGAAMLSAAGHDMPWSPMRFSRHGGERLRSSEIKELVTTDSVPVPAWRGATPMLGGGTAGRGHQAHPRRRIRDFFV